MTQRFLFVTVLFILIATFLHCGGSRKIATEVQPLGFVPFLSENLSPDPAYLNQQLQRTLITSGSFNVIPLSSQPMVADLNTLHQLGDSSVQFILTGRFLTETQQTTAGKHIPAVAYLPKNEVTVKAEILLYNRKERKWQTIREVKGVAAKKGGVQFTGLDKNHPDLQISAPEYARLQQQAYQHLFFNIIKILEKEMEIKKE